MTTIGATTYSTGYSTLASNLAAAATNSSGADGGSQQQTKSKAAVTVTLSAEARAALAAQTSTTSASEVAAAARKAIDALIAAQQANAASGSAEPLIDLSSLDRRSLYAVASNQDGLFSDDEQALAEQTAAAAFRTALAKPLAAARVTGDYAAIYKTGLDYLAKAGPEEKASAGWAQQSAALTAGYLAASKTPGSLPTGIANDAVAAYVAAQGADQPADASRDILAVAGDVRSALDAQYAAEAGKSEAIDFSALDDRSVAAIALNKGGAFSAHEVAAATAEVRSRSSASVMASFNSGDLGQDLMKRYASMSEEERQAQGWTPELYSQIQKNEQTSQKLGGATGAGGYLSALLSASAGTDGSNGASLLDQLT